MKKIYMFLIIAILIFVTLFSSCTIVYERWALKFKNLNTGDSELTIKNDTGDTIDSIKYYVNDYPPSSWDQSGVRTINYYIYSGNKKTFDIGSSSSNDIKADSGDTIWLRLASEVEWNSSKMFASDGFVYEVGVSDTWEVKAFRVY